MQGRVILDGEGIYAPGVAPVRVRRRVAMVSQRPNLFPSMSVLDNVAAGLTLNGNICACAHSYAHSSTHVHTDSHTHTTAYPSTDADALTYPVLPIKDCPGLSRSERAYHARWRSWGVPLGGQG